MLLGRPVAVLRLQVAAEAQTERGPSQEPALQRGFFEHSSQQAAACHARDIRH